MPDVEASLASIAGVVLMGGEGRRMGGADKALIALHGRPILAHALDRFRPQVATLALSANGDPARFAAFALPVLADAADGPGGPLAGVRTALAWARSFEGVAHLATLPGDAPYPPVDLVARLAAAAGEGPAVAVSPSGLEPLHALWPLGCAEALDRLVRDGVSSPRRALAELGAVEVAFADGSGFRDVDTPDDLARLAAGDAANIGSPTT
ncbi:molybdopterin-guanine dinucleotide biosynthesis protein A [Methylopila capsulata]|uniref:Molybdenum cofactor guanylyltransferase n=1 Tax=Methylopila capsulata TaxID=61654 RepID=A0A9W6MRC0_9HYPH|nr:NTP transferase domain-containing protein [Methylopila capsulata]MBM7850262.1 molybdopterin-guanine dinucleotide biosynthesis protein A [Methylopila capsulata]GLK55555.1 molybdenum cofactor guanylyltransferase [Methylopila capsulata]